MAAVRDTTARNIRPLSNAVIQRFTAGATISAGMPVTMQSDGKVDPADTTSATGKVLGIALDSAVDTDSVDVVTYGPVQCMTGATIGAIVHATDTAGQVGESAGTNAGIIGVAISATDLQVNPVIA